MIDDIQIKAKAYWRRKYILFAAGLAVSILYISVFQLGGFSSHLNAAARRLIPNFYGCLAMYLAVFSLLNYLIALPLGYYEGFVLERKFGLSSQNLPKWIKDEVKKGLLSFALSLVLVAAFYFAVRRFPTDWWVLVAGIWILFSVAFAFFFPTLVIPLFYTYRPVSSAEVRDRVIRLTEAAGIKIIDVYEIDFSTKTRKSNAAFAGFGKTRRVILADNLVNEFTPDEVEVVVAHEIAHYKLGHIWHHLLLAAATILITCYVFNLAAWPIARYFGVSHIWDLTLFPTFCLVLMAINLIAMPLHNACCRKLERDADLFALRLTGKREAFISQMERLAAKNLADKNPSRIIELLFYTHPPISRRISLASEGGS